MKHKVKYWDIFNYRFKQLTDNINTSNVNLGGASRALIIIIPLLVITSLIEYLWVKIFGCNTERYT